MSTLLHVEHGGLWGVLRRQLPLVVLGMVVALAASVASGYQLRGGALHSRVATSYESHARMIVFGVSPFAAMETTNSQTTPSDGKTTDTKRTTSTTVAAPAGTTLTGLSPAQLAGVYPYIIEGDDVQQRVRQSLNLTEDDFTVKATRRTTDPGVDETIGISPARDLPVIEVSAVARTDEVARQAVKATTEQFLAYVAMQQDAAAIPADQRMSVQVTTAATEPVRMGRSPVLVQAIVFTGVAAAFVALALARSRRYSYRAAHALVR